MKGIFGAARAVAVPVGAPTITATVDTLSVTATHQPPYHAANSTDTIVRLEPELLVMELREEVALSPIAGQVELEDEVAKRTELTLTALQSFSRPLCGGLRRRQGVGAAPAERGVQANGGPGVDDRETGN